MCVYTIYVCVAQTLLSQSYNSVVSPLDNVPGTTKPNGAGTGFRGVSP